MVTGYLAGSALLIIANQLRSVAGLPAAIAMPRRSAGWSPTSPAIWTQVQWPALALAALTLGVYLSDQASIPAPAGVRARPARRVAGAGMVFERLHLPIERLAGFTPRDLVPVLPDLRDPEVWSQFSPLFGLAFAIAFLAALENSIMARSLASQTGDRIDLNQEMLSVGAANLASSFLSGMPASGSLTRSALNHASGAVSQASSLIAGLLCAVGALMPRWSRFPTSRRPALAMLVICVATSLFNLHHLRICLRATRSDAATLLITLLATLLMPLQVAIFVGVGISIVLYLRKASRPELVEYEFNPRGDLTAAAEPAASASTWPSPSSTSKASCSSERPNLFRTQIQRLAADTQLRVIILRMKNARHLDATSVMALEELVAVHEIEAPSPPHLGHLEGRLSRAEELRTHPDRRSRQHLPGFGARIRTSRPATPSQRAQQLLGTKDAEIQIYYDPSRSARAESRGHPRADARQRGRPVLPGAIDFDMGGRARSERIAKHGRGDDRAVAIGAEVAEPEVVEAGRENLDDQGSRLVVAQVPMAAGDPLLG